MRFCVEIQYASKVIFSTTLRNRWPAFRKEFNIALRLAGCGYLKYFATFFSVFLEEFSDSKQIYPESGKGTNIYILICLYSLREKYIHIVAESDGNKMYRSSFCHCMRRRSSLCMHFIFLSYNISLSLIIDRKAVYM